MKRIAFLLLAFVAVTIADDTEDMLIERIAMDFETDAGTVTECLKEAETTIVGVSSVMKKIKDSSKEIDEETKQAVVKHNTFLACMLEKTGMMEDKTLLTDKIIEGIEKDKDKITVPMPSEKELRECINTLNENKDKMTNGEMAFGLMLCLYTPPEEK